MGVRHCEQGTDHSVTVVDTLKSRLMGATKAFKEAWGGRTLSSQLSTRAPLRVCVCHLYPLSRYFPLFPLKVGAQVAVVCPPVSPLSSYPPLLRCPS